MRNFLFTCLLAISVLGYSQEEKKDSIPAKWNVNGQFTFLFNQSSFSNWKAGGDNTVAGNFAISYDFNFKNNDWNWDNRIRTVFGLSNVKGAGFRKNSDRFEYNSLLGKKTKKKWFLSFFLNFKTQYTKGFDYKKTPKITISNFFAPAYLSFGPGLLWKKSDKVSINIAPATAKFTFVTDKFSGKYGVDPGQNSRLGLGFSLSAYYKLTLVKNVAMENIFSLYSDYLNSPKNIDIDYQMNYDLYINKYLSMNIKLHILIDEDASSKVQFKEIFGLGVKYLFHKK